MRPHTLRSVVAATALLAGSLAAAPAALADSAPPAGTPTTASADALPTVQIDGVVWAQTTIGNKVIAVGDFDYARPAGAAPGTNLTSRQNILAFDIRTGELDPTFNPRLNAAGYSITASPDGSKVYVGGDFTTAGGVSHAHLAAIEVATGKVLHEFTGGVDARVSSLAASDTTVYAGGSFLNAGSTARTRLAAFSSNSGALQPFAPTAQDNSVTAMVLSPQNNTLYVGGRFSGVNDNGVRGLAALDPASGATKPLPVSAEVSNGGLTGGITSLTLTDGRVYGTGFTVGAEGGNMEGTFSFDATDGKLAWVADCHGDSYYVNELGGVVYTASHAHFCGNIGSFGETNPVSYRRGLALTREATRTVAPNLIQRSRYKDWGGSPGPTMLHWYPNLNAGTFTGQKQGPWSVTGTPNGEYVSYGGEFTQVNSTKQEGLVRFAVRSKATNKIGAQSYPSLKPTLDTLTPNSVRVSFQTSWDYDNEFLTYRVTRNGQTVHTQTVPSSEFDRPYIGFTDTGLTPGTSYAYRVYVTDPTGNQNAGSTNTVTLAAGGGSTGRYTDRVVADGAKHLWRFNEAPGSTSVRDWAGYDPLSIASGVQLGQPGAITADSDAGASFPGHYLTGSASSSGAVMAPQTFTIEAWAKTSGYGEVVGFGNRQTGYSTAYDRSLYLDNQGRLTLSLFPGVEKMIRSSARYNDNKWHHVAASLGADGTKLYVDGKLVGSDPNAKFGMAQTGWWRVGGDNLSARAAKPTNNFFTGNIDEVAIYHTALTPAQIAEHYALGLSAGNKAPTAAFTASTDVNTVSVDGTGSTDPDGSITGYAWDFGDGKTASTATATHSYTAAGTYQVTLTVTDSEGATATSTKSVTVAAPPNQAPVAAFTETANGLTVAFDGSGSTDADGTIASHQWNYGDGATGTGATGSHAYAQAGSYDVTLTVTDDRGATHSVTRPVVVSAEVVHDDFERTVAGGWGQAPLGGTWTALGTAADYSVGAGTGQFVLAPTQTRQAYLNSVSRADTDSTVRVSLDKPSVNSGAYVSVIGRRVTGAGDYRATVRYLSNSTATVTIARITGSTETKLSTATVPAVSATQPLNIRFKVESGASTRLSAKIWSASGTEPTGWNVTTEDSTAALQAAGSVGVLGYLSSATTNGPIRYSFDDFTVR